MWEFSPIPTPDCSPKEVGQNPRDWDPGNSSCKAPRVMLMGSQGQGPLHLPAWPSAGGAPLSYRGEMVAAAWDPSASSLGGPPPRLPHCFHVALRPTFYLGVSFSLYKQHLNSLLGLLKAGMTGISFRGEVGYCQELCLPGCQKASQLVDLHSLSFLVLRLRHLNVAGGKV